MLVPCVSGAATRKLARFSPGKIVSLLFSDFLGAAKQPTHSLLCHNIRVCPSSACFNSDEFACSAPIAPGSTCLIEVCNQRFFV